MSRQVFKHLFLGERGQGLTDIERVTTEHTPYAVYTEHAAEQQTEQAHTLAEPGRPQMMASVTHDEPSLGF